jgi:hypothetical protein
MNRRPSDGTFWSAGRRGHDTHHRNEWLFNSLSTGTALLILGGLGAITGAIAILAVSLTVDPSLEDRSPNPRSTIGDPDEFHCGEQIDSAVCSHLTGAQCVRSAHHDG